jgi:hypothetical protein
MTSYLTECRPFSVINTQRVVILNGVKDLSQAD